MKKALITGVTGQDGSYLTELLLDKGYEVHGVKRRSSSFNTQRIEHVYQDIHTKNANFILHYGDLTDASNIISLVQQVQPDEIYNLGAQSHVKVSFELPEYTTDVNALGTLRLLEAIRILGLTEKTKFYQASTSELYGLCTEDVSLNELTKFCPQSPYACAKLYAYWITVNYRNAYKMFASNGILFNHESKRRGETFVTRKISQAAVRIKLGLQDKLYLGNLSAIRDWGHAKDYVEGMWKILQQECADDFVLATGVSASVREFCKKVFEYLDINIEFMGEGKEEKGYSADGKVLVEVDERYFRPTEVPVLIGDYTKAHEKLNWYPKYSLDDIIAEMVDNDYQEIKRKYAVSQDG